MASRGYKCAEFYGLPPDNSSGSRELLLSLMWIVGKENALTVLTQECVRQSPLCQEYSDAPLQKVSQLVCFIFTNVKEFVSPTIYFI